MAKYLDENGLLYYHSKVKDLVDDKVDKVDGKGLSTNDYTTDEKNKLANIEENAQVNVIESVKVNGVTASITGKEASVTIEAGKIDTIKVNGTAQTITDKAVDISVPTKVSDITNDSKFQTDTEVQAKIDDALKDITGIDFKVVTELPSTGVKGTIYLVPNSGTSPNVYDEYIWLSDSSSFEKIGSTAVDLSGYWSKTELVNIPNTDIDTIVA